MIEVSIDNCNPQWYDRGVNLGQAIGDASGELSKMSSRLARNEEKARLKKIRIQSERERNKARSRGHMIIYRADEK